MDDLDKKIKESLEKQSFSYEYHQIIQDTIRKIENDEILREENQKDINSKSHSKVREFKQKSKFVKAFQAVAAVLVVGILSVTTYAGVTGKLNINIGNTGYKKIDKNYNDVATAIDKKIDNEYFTLSVESMAADPAYLIFEYDIKLKDKAMEEIGEVSYNKVDGYGISLCSDTFVNGQQKIQSGGRNLTTIEKISEKEFRLVEIYNIANMKEKTLHLKKVLHNLEIRDLNVNTNQIQLNVDISQILTANVKFENVETKVLAKSSLSNGTTLYIEAVSNSKFENYILARTVSETKEYQEFWSKESQFMFEDYVDFAICDQDDKTINYDVNGLEDYFEKLQDDGSYIAQPLVGDEGYFQIENDDLVRRQAVSLIKLAIDDENKPIQIKVLPICRKIYNEDNYSQYDFYMQEDWYPVSLGEVNIEEKSQVGGSVTVTRIEETEDTIEFYYDRNGYVPSNIDFAINVKNDSQPNCLSPSYYEIKGIDGEEDKVAFLKMSENLLLSTNSIKTIDNLEFAMFYSVEYDILADCLVFEWDENESDIVAMIENIEFTEFVEDINDELTSLHGAVVYKGIVTKVDNKALKFYSDYHKKELTLSNPEQFEYINGRTNESIDFSKIKVGDYFRYTTWSRKDDRSRFVIVRKLSGNELKEELIKQLGTNSLLYHVDFVYREVTNIEVIDKNNAIITYKISDLYQDILGNDESFEIKVLINSDTEIYRTGSWEYLKISDLETVEYVPERVIIYLDPSTINDEMPTAKSIDIDAY